jgi:hypothetical protein
MKMPIHCCGLAAALWLGVGQAADVPQADDIYGYKLMSPLERAEYKAELRSLTSESERREFLQEHRELMQERALEEGVVLPGMEQAGD